VTAPTLSERLRALATSFLCDSPRDTCLEAAAEIERLTSQLEAAAVRLAKPAYHQPPYVDGYFGER
jgi:hypothetical protein